MRESHLHHVMKCCENEYPGQGSLEFQLTKISFVEQAFLASDF